MDGFSRRDLFKATVLGAVSLNIKKGIKKHAEDKLLQRFPRHDNLNTVMARAWLCLRNNPLLKIPQKEGQYWGALSEEEGDVPVGNGRAVWAMYGTSFQIALFNMLINESDDGETRRLLSLSEEYIFDTPIRIKEPKELIGTYWSQENILSQFKGKKPPVYTDQAFRERIWTHSAAWIAFMLAESMAINNSARYHDQYLDSIHWLLKTQRSDGSWPHSWIPDNPPKPSKGFSGDAWWGILALLRGIELNLVNDIKRAKEKLLIALNFMEKEVVSRNKFFGSFEDVGGPVDGYAPFLAAYALNEAFRILGDEKFNKLAKKAWEEGENWIEHTPSPWLVKESEIIPIPSSSNMAMMAHSASSFLRFEKDEKKANASAGLAHISARQRRDPTDKYFGGIDWYDGNTNFSGGWFQAQLLYRGRLSLIERASSFEGVKINPHMKGRIFNEEIKKVLFVWPGIKSQASVTRFTPSPEVDYVVFITPKNKYALLMNHGGLEGYFEIKTSLGVRIKRKKSRPQLKPINAITKAPLIQGKRYPVKDFTIIKL